MPKISPHPYVSWRDGRPRFSPSPELRERGYKGKDLRHPDGRWFTKGEAVDWSANLLKDLAAESRKSKKKQIAVSTPAIVVTAVKPRRAARLMITVGQLYQDWQNPVTGSVKFRGLDTASEASQKEPSERAKKARPGSKPTGERGLKTPNQTVYSKNTCRDIKQKIGLIEIDHPDIWASPVDALTQEVMFGVYEEMVSTRGLGQARGALAWLSVMFSWAKRRGKVTFSLNNGQNPAKDLGMQNPPPRVRFGTREEINALIATADRLGMHEFGDMVVLGVWTGQRQADRLQMTDRGLLNGRRIFRQNKTGAIVAIRESPELTARLKASTDRRKAAGVVSPFVILDEERWLPFAEDGDRYRKRFSLVRAEAARVCPSLLGKDREDGRPFLESDLRDTAVTWMALAGATIPEIVAITGHEIESATQILKHYLARHPQMADAAIAKMIEWYEDKGETDLGF